MRVGFIGIGNMGSLMAGNLVKKGFDVAIFDVDAERMARFGQEYGCRLAGKLLDLAVNDVIVTMLPTGQIVRQVLLGGAKGGLAGALKPGTIVIDMSSSEPLGTQKLGAALAKRQLVLIDAPVSGGVARAQTGKLTIMIGANDAAAVERVRPLLLGMGESLFQTGPLGSGHAIKALNNFVAATCFAATAEAIPIGEPSRLLADARHEISRSGLRREAFCNPAAQSYRRGQSSAPPRGLSLVLHFLPRKCDRARPLLHSRDGGRRPRGFPGRRTCAR